jgi:hypothetical protein
MTMFWAMIEGLPPLRFPAGPTAALAGGCALLAAIFLWLLFRRALATLRHRNSQAANLFGVRELTSCVIGDGPVDLDHLRTTLEQTPVAAALQFMRLHRGAPQAVVIAQAELAGVFDPAFNALGCGTLSREIEALKQLQFARGPRFRSAVLMQAIRGSTPLIRVEALFTYIAMGSTPSEIALAAWIDATGPTMTPRHLSLFQLIADRLPGDLSHLARLVETRPFQEQLAVLAVQHDHLHHPLPTMGDVARLSAPIRPALRIA